MLIYRYLVIMAYSEKLSDTIVLEKCEVYMRPQIKKRANSDYDLFKIYFIYTTLFGKITNQAETDTFN